VASPRSGEREGYNNAVADGEAGRRPTMTAGRARRCVELPVRPEARATRCRSAARSATAS
jgi:hypothetical protein